MSGGGHGRLSLEADLKGRFGGGHRSLVIESVEATGRLFNLRNARQEKLPGRESGRNREDRLARARNLLPDLSKNRGSRPGTHRRA